MKKFFIFKVTTDLKDFDDMKCHYGKIFVDKGRVTTHPIFYDYAWFVLAMSFRSKLESYVDDHSREEDFRPSAKARSQAQKTVAECQQIDFEKARSISSDQKLVSDLISRGLRSLKTENP